MASQLSKKAALPLAKILATCRNNVSNTGPWVAFELIEVCKHRCKSFCFYHTPSYWNMHEISSLKRQNIYLLSLHSWKLFPHFHHFDIPSLVSGEVATSFMDCLTSSCERAYFPFPIKKDPFLHILKMKFWLVAVQQICFLDFFT